MAGHEFLRAVQKGPRQTQEDIMFRTPSSAKPLLLAALLALAAVPALAQGAGTNEPASLQARPQVFAIGAPRLDIGAQAYPSTSALGTDQTRQGVNHVTREQVPAYQHGFDVGSQAYPAPR